MPNPRPVRDRAVGRHPERGKMRRVSRLLALVLAAGCGGGGPEPSCAEVAASAAGDTAQRDVIAERCQVDEWPRAVRRCFVEIGVRLDSDQCLRHLGAKQRDALVTQAQRTSRLVEKRIERELVELDENKLPADIDLAKASLVVEVSEDGVAIGGRRYSDGQLANIFRVAYAKDHDTQLIVKAATGALHGRVVRIMELAKRAGLQRIAIGMLDGTAAH